MQSSSPCYRVHPLKWVVLIISTRTLALVLTLCSEHSMTRMLSVFTPSSVSNLSFLLRKSLRFAANTEDNNVTLEQVKNPVLSFSRSLLEFSWNALHHPRILFK